MDLTQEHKRDIEKKIVETIISALEAYQITEDQYNEISKYILEQIDGVRTHHDLMVFLRELTAKWNIFSFVLTLENGEVKKLEDNTAIKKVEELVNNGNINDALNIAKQATNNSNTNI